MERLKRIASGRHTTAEIRCHLFALAIIYWGLVFCAWLGYPTENRFSIMTEMLSALGSFNQRYNPHWFWMFSIAMVYCGLAMTPIMLYIRRRFVAVSSWGAEVGAFFFLLASLAILLTGVFPYADGKVIGDWEWEDFHMKTAVTIAIGFAGGLIWHMGLVLKDKFTTRELASPGKFPYLKYLGPFLACMPIMGIVAYNMRWTSLGQAVLALARAGGGEAARAFHDTFHHMPHAASLEHVAIWTATIFVIWFAWVLPNESEYCPARAEGE